MKFKIEDKMFEDYPGLYVGVIVARGVDNTGEDKEIAGFLRSVEEKVKSEMVVEGIPTHLHIAPWRAAYEKFGAKPKDFRCSAEALARMVLNGRELRHINKLVDIYNYISLKYVLTLGGEDIDQMKGDLVLGYADGTEQFTPLGSKENDSPLPGEVVYKDEIGVICRRWNWREADRTKLTEETESSILVVEGLPPIENETIEKAINELSELVKKYCGGDLEIYFLDKNNLECTIG